jgi:hypothetical protein
MIAIVLFSLVFAAALALLLARFAPNPAIRRAAEADRRSLDGRPRISPTLLRSLVIDVLAQLGLGVVEEEVIGDQRRLIATRQADLPEPAAPDARYVVFVEPAPPGDLVEQPLIVELSDYVKAERAAVGMLITPYEISTAGLAGIEVPIELIDGTRLRQLVATYLPSRAAELDHFRGFDAPRVAGHPAPARV